ncbi:secondary carrier transporter [Lithospermum erythrorhizon]|uniref:Secondary carrier transporter n=1 Tax=Lithospermum erythrorhizon TaxID=34254 RepID=A0AAV3NYN8_LITER
MEVEKKSPSSAVSDMGAWAMNVVSSVGLIMANKELMSPNGFAFSYATSLTGFHFAVTAIVGMVSNATGLSASKHAPLWELLWFSAVANMSITGMNLSLMLNSVGFYQISKLSMIPVVCVMEWIIHNKHYSKEDVCCCCVFCTSLQQISIGSLQKKYSIGSFELLSKTAPIQAGSLLVLGPFIDYYLTRKRILAYNFITHAIYLCIGRFSATSFQVLGHMKTVCVLLLGWMLFDSELTIKNIFGMLVAVVGMVIYSWAAEAEKKSNTKILPHAKNSYTEEEFRLLKDENLYE